MAIPPWGYLICLHPAGILGFIVQLTGLGLIFYLFNKKRAYKCNFLTLQPGTAESRANKVST